MISVLIPCYNYGHLLAETLQSLLQQTYTDWEAIIVDSASTDSTKTVANNFIEKDKRIRYFYNSKGGISASRNIGILNSQGDFIQFLDADDLLQAKKFETDLRIFSENPEADAVYSTSLYFEHPNSNIFYSTYRLTAEVINPFKINPNTDRRELLDKISTGNIFTINSVLFKKDKTNKIDLFDEELKHNEDWHFWFTYIVKGKKFCFYDAPETKSLVRIHKTSVSQNQLKMLIGGMLVCKKMIVRPELSLQREILNKKITVHRFRLLKLISEALSKKENIFEKIKELNNVLEEKEIKKIVKLSAANKTLSLKIFLKFSMLKCKLKLL